VEAQAFKLDHRDEVLLILEENNGMLEIDEATLWVGESIALRKDGTKNTYACVKFHDKRLD